MFEAEVKAVLAEKRDDGKKNTVCKYNTYKKADKEEGYDLQKSLERKFDELFGTTYGDDQN